MRKYKICMLCDRFDIGGAETHVLTLANALCEEGHTVALVTEGGAYTEKLHKDIRVFHLPLTKRPLSLSILFRLCRLIKREGFDVLHAHTRITAFYCRLLSTHRTVVTAHWVFDTSFPKKQLSFWGKQTLAVSEDIKDYLVRTYRLSPESIRVTVNGIDTALFIPKKKKGITKICLCSRLDKDRADAAFALLRAAASLSDTHAFSLQLIGDGDAMPALRDLAEALSRRHAAFHPVFLGARTDVSRFLSDADIFVGVSRAALEAMAAGCAVILAGNEGYLSIFDPQDPTEAEKSNFCCRGASPVTVAALTRDLMHLLSAPPEERYFLGEKCRAYVKRQYSVSRMTKDAYKAYTACVRDRAVLCGYYGSGNVGDELLRIAITRRLKKEGYADVLLLSLRHPSPSAVYAILRRYDFFLGGGNLLQDTTSCRSLRFYLALLSLAQRRGCHTALIGAGLGPLSDEGKERVRVPLSRTDEVECRTLGDLWEARALGAPQAIYAPDPVLSLLSPAQRKERNGVMLAFRAPDGKNASFVYAVAKRATEVFRGSCFFFAMHPADAPFAKRLAKRLSVPFVSGNAKLFIHTLGHCRLVIGDRLHAGICAFGMEIPFLLDGDDAKCARFLQDVKKAAVNSGFCGDIRRGEMTTAPSNAGMKQAKDRLLRR